MGRRYKAYINYSWADKAWADWAHRALETYQTPRSLVGAEGAFGPVADRLNPIFKDREEEAAGHGITTAIEAALGASDFLIVICSPRSAQSRWVNREIAWFKRHRDKSRILAIVVEGETLASLTGDYARECFPNTHLYEVGETLEPTGVAEDPPLARAPKSPRFVAAAEFDIVGAGVRGKRGIYDEASDNGCRRRGLCRFWRGERPGRRRSAGPGGRERRKP